MSTAFSTRVGRGLGIGLALAGAGIRLLAGPAGPIEWTGYAELGGGWGRMVALTNGQWLAVTTQYPAGTNSFLRISRSTDRVRTWVTLTEVREAGRTLDNGELVRLPDGTLLLTLRSLIPNVSYRLPVYASDDGGRTWRYRSTIDASEGEPARDGRGLWEPDFWVLDDGRLVVTYSNETHPGYSQLISLRVSTDSGRSWGPESRAVTPPQGSPLRPGMSQMTRLASGEYLLVYEVVNLGRADVYRKFSPDGVTWPEGLGTRVPCQHCGPFVATLANGLVLVSSCENQVSFSEDHGRTWQKIDPPAWNLGHTFSWPAIYQTGPDEVAVLAVNPGVRLRFGRLRPRPRWPDPWTADFDDGTDAGWTRYGSGFAVRDGRYGLNHAGTYGQALSGDGFWTDGTLEADVRLTSPGNAGLMFRTTNPDYEGPDHAFGYYAGLDSAGLVLLGRMSNAWTLLTNRPFAVSLNTWYRLKVVFAGSQIRVFVNDSAGPLLTFTDSHFTRGQVGVRAFQCNAEFDNLRFSNAAPLRLNYRRSPAGLELGWPATSVTVRLVSSPTLFAPGEPVPRPPAPAEGGGALVWPIPAEPARFFWLSAP